MIYYLAIIDGRQPVVGQRGGKSWLSEKRLLSMRVVIEEGGRSVEEVVEDADVSLCVDESGNLFVRKLVMLLKQEYNFTL